MTPLTNKRHYHRWVANETLEDYALRYTAESARKYSIGRVANTALGIVSFLALEAIGGAITLQFGFSNAMMAISIVSSLIFLMGLPICYHAAKNGLDIDLLTRGAGFGYVGSTISSLIYAAFTFIFFAIEAVIMATAVTLLFDLPLSISYLLSATAIIPLVTHGIRRISQFQLLSQPIWVLLQLIVIGFILMHEQHAVSDWKTFTGINHNANFNWHLVGFACTIIFPLMAQNGEQVDYLRFLPKPNSISSTLRWWLAVIFAGPGWVIVGAIKMILGSFLAFLAFQQGASPTLSSDPTHMYLHIAEKMIIHPVPALIIVCLFVILSQIKINVTNAYAGSIAWSNFFSRITHQHPGRVVWLVFNVTIAFILMEIGLYQSFESILMSYSALVLGWLSTIVADLTLNRWLKLRPKSLHFMRSQLVDINPVGCLSMLTASSFGVLAQFGWFGESIKSFAPFIVLLLPFSIVPLLTWLTQGRFYLVPSTHLKTIKDTASCCLCEHAFEAPDMHHCPFYNAPICSLCCALDVSCNNTCRPEASIKAQLTQFFRWALPDAIYHRLLTRFHPSLSYFAGLMTLVSMIFYLVFHLVLMPFDDNLFPIA
ncbi:MAG: hybrid sensor histidine kinase/response regulator, partial [Cellvibrionales bacterium]|nr:hybrid sensor histidine kinase/response regulator [Cellvibrionales bacterium]